MGVIANVVGVTVSDNFAVMQHNDAVGYFVGACHIVGNNNACQAQFPLQFQDKLVNGIGSSPVVGSSYKITSGFRAIALASATLLR